MSSHEKPSDPAHDAEAVREFFNHWSLYRRIVDLDYLYHRSVQETMGRWLDSLGRPFSFLDLGCGDAAFSARLLRGRQVTRYAGIDLSPVALDLAKQNLADCEFSQELHQGDFVTMLGSLSSSYDVIYIGLSLHHLLSEEKKALLAGIQKSLNPGGYLLIYDPVRLPGETRDEFMQRWVNHAQKTWMELTPEELASAIEHVTSADFPEEIAGLDQMAVDAGFYPAELLYRDPFNFYAQLAFRVGR